MHGAELGEQQPLGGDRGASEAGGSKHSERDEEELEGLRRQIRDLAAAHVRESRKGGGMLSAA